MYVIVYQVKWCDTPLAPCIPDTTTRVPHFACYFPTAPVPRKYLIFECVSLPTSKPCFFSKSTPRRIIIIYYPSWHNFYPRMFHVHHTYFAMDERGHFDRYLKNALTSAKIRYSNGW